ncbi:MAG: adenosine kinase [Moraxella sp.]|nr:adenosine kinase [Moraxella sp.]
MFDVVAIGNALVDTEFQVSNDVLVATALSRGTMTLTDTHNQNTLFDTLAQHHISATKQSGGGSAANSMVAFAALGGSAFYNCRVGDDQLGKFYLADLQKAGVSTNAATATATGTTGSCAVLVTPDGERTMQTNLGISSQLSADNIEFDLVKKARYLYLEGYLAMSPIIMNTINELIDIAQANSTHVVVSFADPAVVNFTKDGLMTWLNKGVDIIFCNMDEAKLFASTDDAQVAVNTLLQHSKLAVVTNSDQPTRIGSADGIQELAVPPASAVLDTNGAGDNFAGAFLYGLTQNLPPADCVKLAGAVASQVVAQFGARLPLERYRHAKAQVFATL